MADEHTESFKLGDAIASLTGALHIPPCEKCEQRRKILNEMQRVGIKETLRRLKEVGFSYSWKEANERKLEAIKRQLEECCGDNDDGHGTA